MSESAWSLDTSTTFLGDDSCWERIRHHEVGRIAFADESGTVRVFPLAYVEQDGYLYFRTSAYGSLAEYGDGPASFQIDEILPTARSGWSVLMTGRVQRVLDPYEVASVWAVSPVKPWADGWRELTLRFLASSVTGVAIHSRTQPGTLHAAAPSPLHTPVIPER